MSVQHDTSVRAQIVVEASIERAFVVFTEGIGSWFPREYNLLEVEIAERLFEPREGGHVYDRCRGAVHLRGARPHTRRAGAPPPRAAR
jgi:hypothetical protein